MMKWGVECRQTRKWHALLFYICVDKRGGAFDLRLWWITLNLYVYFTKRKEHDEQPDTSLYLG
jgi:hypothetical protein